MAKEKLTQQRKSSIIMGLSLVKDWLNFQLEDLNKQIDALEKEPTEENTD